MLCWLITICTIARLWIVISWFIWEMRTRESDRDSAVRTALCICDSFECCERGRSRVWPTRLAFTIRKRERGTEGGSESERLGWHSRFANENEGRREEVSLNDSAGIRDSRMRTRGGGRKWVWTTHWMIHRYRKHDWTNERTNERLFLVNWTTRTDSRKRIMKSTTNGKSGAIGGPPIVTCKHNF